MKAPRTINVRFKTARSVEKLKRAARLESRSVNQYTTMVLDRQAEADIQRHQREQAAQGQVVEASA